MKKRLLCAIAAAGLVFTCASYIPVLAENKAEEGIIIYELGDPRVPVPDPNAVVHDLNTSEEYGMDLQSVEDVSEKPVIVYELGDPRVPVIDCDVTENLHILEESVTRGDQKPDKYYNLAFGAYDFSFSNVRQYVYTNRYFSPNANGYISVSTSGIENSVRISMIEYGTDTVVHTWQGDPQSIAGLGFYGDSSKFYYYKFEPYGVSFVSGSGQIFWDN